VSQSKRARFWTWWAVGGVLSLAVFALGGYLAARSEAVADEPSPGDQEPPGVRVQVVHPAKGKANRITRQPGTLKPFESARLFAQVSGYIKEQTVDIGARVTRGQPLIVLDVPELEKQVERHKAAVEQAKARVAQMNAHVASAVAAKDATDAAVLRARAASKSAAAYLVFRQRELARLTRLSREESAIEPRLVEEKEKERDAAREAAHAGEAAVATAKAEVKAAEAKIAQARADVVEANAEVRVAEADLRLAQVMVGFATIRAPFDGLVTYRSRFPFDFVRAGEQGARVPLLTVERTDKFRVVVQVADRDVPYADKGDRATV
jgi:multidrug resistance efflux pump